MRNKRNQQEKRCDSKCVIYFVSTCLYVPSNFPFPCKLPKKLLSKTTMQRSSRRVREGNVAKLDFMPKGFLKSK